MNKYYTLMVIPSGKGKIKKIKIPAIIINSAALFMAMFLILVSIIIFDYWKVFKEVYKTNYIGQENKLLKEQLTLFKNKIDNLSTELNRLHVFEKKLKIITGLEGEVSQSIKKLNKQSLITPSPHLINEPQYEKIYHYYQKKVSDYISIEKNKDQPLTISPHQKQLIKDFTQLDYQYGKMKQHLIQVEEDLNELDEFIIEKKSLLESTPTLQPANGWITSYFGPRMSPYAGKIKMHEGLDIGAPIGTPIIAPADGIVTFSGTRTGFGNFIKINHGYGVETSYAHAHRLLVRTGKKVKRGDLIAKVGNTGYSTGPHLHYEIHINGIPVDPYYFILK